MQGRRAIRDPLRRKGRRKRLQVHVESGPDAAAAGIEIRSCAPDHRLEPIRATAPRALVSAGMPDGSIACAADAARRSHSPRLIGAMAREGIPVTGHVGLVPDPAAFRAAGTTAGEALAVLHRLRDPESAGCASCAVEALPVDPVAHFARATPMPRMGGGCGAACDRQSPTANDPRHAKPDAECLAPAVVRPLASGAGAGTLSELRPAVGMVPTGRDAFAKRTQNI